MDFIGWLSIISGIVGIAGFMFAVWVWLRADLKVREVAASIRALHDIADSALWETQVLPGDDVSRRLSQLEKAIGLVSAMRTLSAKYVGERQNYGPTEIGALIRRGVLWTNSMISGLELSGGLKSVWLWTPDLEPDLSESNTGDLVLANLKAGKNYTYFFPAELKSPDEQLRRLRRNIGANDARRSKRVTFVPVGNSTKSAVFGSRQGNIILFFRDDPSFGTTLIFEEVVLNKIQNRGLFWQECTGEDARDVFEAFRHELALAIGSQ